MVEDPGHEVVGVVGRLSVPISGGRPGEVMVPVRGGVEAYRRQTKRC